MRAMRWIAEVFTRDAHSGVVYCSAPVVSSTSSNGGFSPKPLGLGLFFAWRCLSSSSAMTCPRVNAYDGPPWNGPALMPAPDLVCRI